MRFGFFLIACLGCTSTQPKPVARKGWVDHMQSADRHDRRAAEHERAAASVEGAPVPERFDCGDPDLPGRGSVWVMNADGSHVERILDGATAGVAPDGSSLDWGVSAP